MRYCSKFSAGIVFCSSLAMTSAAFAGGFDIREQSSYFQGMSFAGSAAGGDLSSMFWNPAGASAAGMGLTTESSLSLIIPDSEITGSVTGAASSTIAGYLNSKEHSVQVGELALVPASYAAWRSAADPNAVFAVSINSQFGLATKPDDFDWAGQEVAQSAQIFSTNISPTISYDLLPGVTVGAGVQIEYFELTRLRSSIDPLYSPATGAYSKLRGDDWGIGFTLGLLLEPMKGTSIGVGYRSSIEHDLDGDAIVNVAGSETVTPIEATLDTPDKITASFRQELTPNLRALGTVEWTNWSKFDVIPVNVAGTSTTIANIDAQWHDGWFFSLGGEYDYSDQLTLRTGVGYEKSPIQNASERLLQIPDANRIWLSLGTTYKLTESTSLDFSYTHLFVEDSETVRNPASTNPVLAATEFTGDIESSLDIVTVGVKTKW